MLLLFGGLVIGGRDYSVNARLETTANKICRRVDSVESVDIRHDPGPRVQASARYVGRGASGMPRKFTFCRFLRVWTMSDQFRSKNLATWKSVGHLGFCDESCLVATCSVFLDRPKQWAGPLQRIFATLAAPGSPWRFGMFWTIWMV